jgi:hypothetical protein
MWQYNGDAPWKEIKDWCKECIPDNCSDNGFETIYFNDYDSYVLFLLRWI